MPITTPDLPTISQSVASAIATRLPGADATPPRSALGVLAKVLAGAVDGLYGAIQTVGSEIIYDTASADYLVRWASIWGLTQNPPTSATGLVTFTGSGPTVPAGTILARADGVQYILAGTVTLTGNTGSGTVTCVSAGSVTNTAAGGTLTLTSPVSGIASTATVGSGGLSAGADLETTEALLGRLMLRLKQTPQGGSSADFVEWAMGVPGVTRVWVYPAWQGVGTVGVFFMCDGRSNPIPQAADVAAVQAAINAMAPVTCQTFVLAPTPVPLNFTIHLNPASPANQTAVQTQLASLIANQCVPGGTLYLSHIWAAISAAAGEVDFTLASPTANVVSAAGSIGTMGAITWA